MRQSHIDVDLPREVVADIIRRTNAQPWFLYAFEERVSRWHAWAPSLWLAEHLGTGARVLETGCGCALNLIWFGQLGFRHLYGFDTDTSAIAAGNALCAAADVSAKLWIDDGLQPKDLPPEPFDAILAINWTYHVDDYDLTHFLGVYR